MENYSKKDKKIYNQTCKKDNKLSVGGRQRYDCRGVDFMKQPHEYRFMKPSLELTSSQNVLYVSRVFKHSTQELYNVEGTMHVR